MTRGQIAAVAIAACACGLLIDTTSRADEVTVSRVAQVWAEREARAKACRVTWSETKTYPKGSPYIALRADPKDLPATDVSISATCTLLIAGHKTRYEYHGQMQGVRTMNR